MESLEDFGAEQLERVTDPYFLKPIWVKMASYYAWHEFEGQVTRVSLVGLLYWLHADLH